MNLLVKKFGPLAAMLLSALLVISCEDPGKIGLIVNAENGVISTHYQDIVLPTSVVQFNPRNTLEARSIQAGQYFNPDFGLITSKSYTQLSLDLIIPPESNAEFQSFEMEISFASLIGDVPDNSETQQIDIYQLADDIDTTIAHTRLDEMPLMPDRLGTWIFAPKRNDTIQTDTVFTLPLDNMVGADLFEKLKAGDPIFDSDAAFNAYFKGVGLVPTNDNTNIFQVDPDKMFFIIKYNEFNSDGTPIERTYEMRVGNFGFYHIDSDKSGTPLSGISPDNTDFTPPDDYRYLQYGTLMAIRADLTPFYELTDTLDNMIINKAVLSITGVKQYGEFQKPPTFLQTYFTNETNQWPIVDDIGRIDSSQVGVNFIMLQKDDSAIPVPPGAYNLPQSTFYDPTNYRYDVNMSIFLQNLYSGNYHDINEPFIEEKGKIFLFGESDVLFAQKTSSHVLTTPLAVHKDSIRLRIHYTIPIQVK